jgi:hypothetical protein
MRPPATCHACKYSVRYWGSSSWPPRDLSIAFLSLFEQERRKHG